MERPDAKLPVVQGQLRTGREFYLNGQRAFQIIDRSDKFLFMSDEKSSRGHMDGHPQNDWETIHYDARYDAYWVKAGNAKQTLFFCPWCGEHLPRSQRDRWFDELEAVGVDPGVDPIPEDFQIGAWRGAPSTTTSRTREGGPIEGRYIDLFDVPFDGGI